MATLPQSTTEELEEQCEWLSCDTGELIIDYLDSDDCMYFLTAGSAKVIIYSEAGKAVAFRALNNGDMFGEFAALDGRPRTASVVATQPCTLAKLSSPHFRELLSTEPLFAESMCKHLVAQVRTLTARIYEFSTLAVQNRIHAELLRLARKSERGNEPVRISPAPKHAEIASRISTHREAVSREFSRLNKAGLIARKGADLYIYNISQLMALVHEASGEESLLNSRDQTDLN